MAQSKEEIAAKQREWRLRNPEKVKANALKFKEKQKAAGKTAYSSLKDKAKSDPLVTFNSMLTGAKARATAVGRSFSITNKDVCYLWVKQQGKCALTGSMMTTELGSGDPFLASIDRINSDFGYTEENIQLVAAAVNCMKSNHSQERFVEICKLVAKAHQ